MLSPERSIEVQRLLGADIVMAFDQLVPATADARRGAGRGDGAVDALGEAVARRVRCAAASMRGARRCSGSSRAGSTRAAPGVAPTR